MICTIGMTVHQVEPVHCLHSSRSQAQCLATQCWSKHHRLQAHSPCLQWSLRTGVSSQVLYL